MIEKYYVVEFLNGYKKGWQPVVIFTNKEKAEKWIELSVEDGFDDEDHRIVKRSINGYELDIEIDKDGYYNL